MVAFHEGRKDARWTIVLPSGDTQQAYGLETCARNMVEAWLDAQDAAPAKAVA